MNRGTLRNNTSGTKGITEDKVRGKWAVDIHIGDGTRYRERFKTLEEAKSAIRVARVKYHGEFGREE